MSSLCVEYTSRSCTHNDVEERRRVPARNSLIVPETRAGNELDADGGENVASEGA